VCNFLGRAGLQRDEFVERELQRRVEAYFIYRMVSTEMKYLFYKLDSDDSIEVFTQMIGTMSVFGVRKRLPRKDSEVVI
jgi:formamidopyrimidine-DNA glycosylase